MATDDNSMPAGSKPASSAASRKNPGRAADIEEPRATMHAQRISGSRRRIVASFRLARVDVVAIDARLVLGVNERGHVLQLRLLGQEDDRRLLGRGGRRRFPCGRTRGTHFP